MESGAPNPFIQNGIYSPALVNFDNIPVPGVFKWYSSLLKASPFLSQIALFRPSTGLWAIRGVSRAYFETFCDIPVTR